MNQRSPPTRSYERRTGYSWYTDAPQEVFDKYPEWKEKWVNF